MIKVTSEQIAEQYKIMHGIHKHFFSLGKKPKCFIRTFGCQQNEADSEQLRGMTSEMGYERCETPEEADLILVNTCAVREHAELRALSTTGQFKKLKEKNPELLIGVCGCMVTQEHRMNQLKKSYPYVDFLIGTGMLYRLPEIISEQLGGGKRSFTVDLPEGTLAEGLPIERESKTTAWVSVMYGCNNFCSYCVVPYTRGRERSRERADIIAEVKSVIADGAREITLLGQNVNSYSSEGQDFADLVDEICKLDGDFILRFMTSHPKDASKKLIDTMAANDKCAKQFHLPLQSGSARILHEMNRKYTPDTYMALVEYMREKMPDIALSSDIIVGFPGETDAEFDETLAMLKKVGFDMVYSFIYSPRPLTPAAAMTCQIPPEVKSARFDRLLEVQNEISLAKNLSLVGKVQRILIEGESKNSTEMLTGRADSNKLVHIPRDVASERLIGKFANVKITKAETFALFGELVIK